MGGLKIWGSASFFEVASLLDFDSVLHKVLYWVILKQFHQHFDKKI